MWLLHHAEAPYALLGLSKAVELEPDNKDYRYDLATTLHAQLEAAQRNCRKSSSATRPTARRGCC
jgi:cytochrome c-type biogenesis protein CcmH/NrfG